MRYHQIVENTENINLNDLKIKYPDYSEAFDRYEKGFRIYKGLRNFTNDVDIEILKPLKRKSQNTTNHMTTLMSNLPEWSAYPKRNYCTVCSSNYDYAKNYGRLFCIFPENGSKIGVCPRDDIFVSFKISVPGLNRFLDKISKNDNFESIINNLKNVFASDKNSDKKIIEYEFPIDERRLRGGMDINSFENFIEFISPDFNQFKLVNAANYSVTSADDREVWTDGNCLAVRRKLSLQNNAEI